MEEVEQICSRIAIMEKGKIVALGTKDELKAGINIGETIRIDTQKLNDNDINSLKLLPDILSVSNNDGQLVVKFNRKNNNLKTMLNFMQERDISYNSIYSELPTLNDVFLEITGKELRD